MGIAVQWWEEDQQVLYWNFEGRWDFEDLHAAIMKSRAYRVEADRPLDMIFDVRQMGLVPVNVVSGLRNLSQLGKTNRGEGNNIVIGADYYLKLLWHFMSQDLRLRWQLEFVDHLDEALDACVYTARRTKQSRLSNESALAQTAAN